MQPSLRPPGLWYSSSRRGGTDPEQESLPDNRSNQDTANVCKVYGSRQQSPEAARATALWRGQEINAVRVSGRNTGTFGAEIFQVQHCPAAGFSMNSLALMKSDSKATPKQMNFCYMLISQDSTLPLWFLSGQLSISSVQ